MVKFHLAAIVGTGFAFFVSSCDAQAQTFQIGDTADCSGNVGVIARIDPRPGWDEPFYVVEVRRPNTTYEFKCTPSQLKPAPGQAPAQPPVPAPAAQAQNFEIGGRADCSGNVGTIVRIDPRPGWDEPFMVVEVRSSNVVYEFKCTPSQLKAAPAPGPAQAPNPANAPAAPNPAPAPTGDLCRPGAKIEGQWGISWYEVTVRAAPNQDGECPVSFDGYGREWDMPISMDQLRPRGGGDIYRPRNPVADAPDDTVSAGGAVPDGRYRCHKISPGGQLMDIGTLVVRGGQGTVIGMPAGWTTRSISVRGTDPRGKLLVAYDYRSEAGFNDRLDCSPQ